MLDKRLRSYYKQLMAGNRNTIARVADFIATRAVVYLVVYIWVSTSARNTTLGLVIAAVVTLLATVAIEMYKNAKMDKFIARKRVEMSKEYMFENLVIAQKEDFFDMIHNLADAMGYMTTAKLGNGFVCQGKTGDESVVLFALQYCPDYEVQAQDILDCYRTATSLGKDHALIVSTAPFSDSARVFIRKLNGFTVTLISRERLLELADEAGLLPDSKEVETALINELEHRRMTMGRLKKEALFRGKSKAYIICGISLLVAAYITGHTIYYPMIGGLCFFLAFASYRNNNTVNNK